MTEIVQPRVSTNNLIQIIDENGGFIAVDTFNDLSRKWGFMEKGFDYYIVAVLGPQSSGKSTLLNLLFGTSFSTLDATEGRVQVTKGIWMGHTKAVSDKEETMLVFDVEGVDGRERGEKEAAFEKKTSLFSLALSDVLIVNMWHTDVGRYAAGNIALLKTVFEQHLLLFGKARSRKTLIMFVIRDHLAAETPLTKLQTIIMKDMVGIWEGLQKPDEFSNSKMDDFFVFSFTGLPHKILAANEFSQGVENLRKRFLEAKTPDWIFKEISAKDVPSDGVAAYASSIWQTIRENKDLDLPSQKEMLAMFRCDEIMETVLKVFTQSITPIKSSLEKGHVEEFGRKITEISNTVLGLYDTPASRYHPEVAARKRSQLAGTMNTELFSMFTKQLQKISEKSLGFFEKLVTEAMPTDGTACKDFDAVSKTMVSTLEYFEQRAKDSLLGEASWDYQIEFEELQSLIQKKSRKFKRNTIKSVN